MIDSVNQIQLITPRPIDTEPALIELKDIKAILYLGLRGEVALPIEDHEVDILA